MTDNTLKPFKTLDEQLNLLKIRGFVIVAGVDPKGCLDTRRSCRLRTRRMPHTITACIAAITPTFGRHLIGLIGATTCPRWLIRWHESVVPKVSYWADWRT
jgi:hypothetical protein